MARLRLRAWTVVVGIVLFGSMLAPAEPRALQATEAGLWLWAWERPEDLRFLAGKTHVGVAYLASTLLVDRAAIRESPRRQPLRVPDDVPLTAVVRVEIPRGAPPDPSTLDGLTLAATRVLAGTRARRLQIDFDARASEVAYYEELLTRLRRALPAGVSLGMTALAAWCSDERSWLASMKGPPDEIVPMVFAMGPDAPWVRASLALRAGFPVAACRRAFGTATNESTAIPPGVETVYAFSPSAWTEASFDAMAIRDHQ